MGTGKKIHLNSSKSKCLIVKKSKQYNPSPILNIQVVESLKVLGVVWSDNLSWNDHLLHISRLFAQRIHCLRTVRGFVSKKDLLLIYNGPLRSLLEYCSPLLVGMPEGMANDLEKLQRRAHRIICGPECAADCMQPIRDRRISRAVKLFEQSFNAIHIIHDLLLSRSVRSSRLIIPPVRTSRRLSFFAPFMTLLKSGFTNKC